MVTTLAETRAWRRGTCDYLGPDTPVGCLESHLSGLWRTRNATRCIRECEACRQCRFVSFHGGDSECAWFSACPTKLKRMGSQWRWTSTVRASDGTLLPGQPDAVPALPDSLPEDGTQGYAPYFYQMDEPVRVRRTISYGRGFQLLRSRGAGSEEQGPCDPAQLASSCNCSSDPAAAASSDKDVMPECAASAFCGARSPTTASAPPAATAAARVAIVLVLDMSPADLRFSFGGSMKRGYEWVLRYVVRLCLSLRAANTTVPLRLLPSGERQPAVETALASRLGLVTIDADGVPPHRAPAWASKWARASFAKLRALALTQFERLLLLDTDTLVLRNIDALLVAAQHAPAPAAVFGWKCFPRRELRTALLVLVPRREDWTRAERLMADASTAVYDDLGEGSVWRKLYPRVHELPAGYCALRTADLAADEWRRVSVLHDPHLLHRFHRGGWERAGMDATLQAIEDATDREMAEGFKPLLRGGRAKHGGGKRRGNRRRKRGAAS